MGKTAAEFDTWIANKRQRPIGICNECCHERELRQREPEPLCGACYMKVDRRERREADALAAKKDARKREKKIRSGMNKVLSVADDLEGLVNDNHLNELSRIAKVYLKLIIGGPDGDGHGHDDFPSDRDQEADLAVTRAFENQMPESSSGSAGPQAGKSDEEPVVSNSKLAVMSEPELAASPEPPVSEPPKQKKTRPTSSTKVPTFRYPGGKARLANRIAAMLPSGNRFVEPFAGRRLEGAKGSGRMFLDKLRGGLEPRQDSLADGPARLSQTKTRNRLSFSFSGGHTK